MQKWSAVSLAAAVLAVSGAAGCGGDDEGLSKDEYLRRGDAICAKINPTIPDLASIESQLGELRDLPAPEGDEDEVNRILDASDQALQRAKADPQSLAEGKTPFAEAIDLAKAYGLTKCGL